METEGVQVAAREEAMMSGLANTTWPGGATCAAAGRDHRIHGAMRYTVSSSTGICTAGQGTRGSHEMHISMNSSLELMQILSGNELLSLAGSRWNQNNNVARLGERTACRYRIPLHGYPLPRQQWRTSIWASMSR